MEFFHEPKIDWMGIKWYFISLSLALALTGIVSMVVHQGLVYGIDFRGGTLVDVKFSQPPNTDAIRHELDNAGLRNATIQGSGPASDNAVIIGLDLQTTTSSNALDTGKQAIVSGLSSLYGKGPEGKTDFNNASPQTVADHLTADDPSGSGNQRVWMPPPKRIGILPTPWLITGMLRRAADCWRILTTYAMCRALRPSVISALVQGLLPFQLRRYQHQNRGPEGGLRPAPPSPLCDARGLGRHVDLHLVSF